MKTIVASMFILVFCSFATAGKLSPLHINTLQDQSGVIVIGKIANIQLLNDGGKNGKTYAVDVKVISSLKGSVNLKKISLTLWKGGSKGFNVIPEVNSFWTLFLLRSTDSTWRLVHPKSMIKFDSHIYEN